MRIRAEWGALALLMACGGDEPDDTAGPEGLPDIEDAVFELSVGGMSVVGADEGFTDLLQLFFARPVMLHTTDVTDTAMGVRIVLGVQGSDPPVQDVCLPTVDLPDATLDGLAMEIGPVDTEYVTPDGVGYGIEDMHVTGSVSSSGERLTSLVLEGTFDLRQAEGFAGFETAQDICDTVAGLGVTCVACDDGPAYCIDLTVEGLTADRVEVDVVPVEQADPTNCSR